MELSQPNSPSRHPNLKRLVRQSILVGKFKQKMNSNVSIENCFDKLKKINEKIEKIDLKMEIKDILKDKEKFSIDKLNTVIKENKMK